MIDLLHSLSTRTNPHEIKLKR